MNTPPVFSYLSFSDNEARLRTYVRKCREEDITRRMIGSLIEIYGSACERLDFRAGGTAIETIAEIPVRHLPLGVFRENFNKPTIFRNRPKTDPDSTPLTLREP
jgi:hypothetical protein